MSKGKFVKLPQETYASELFAERPGETIMVIVRSISSQKGYWGRGWAIQNALRGAGWISQGETVGVALCSRNARIGGIDGSVIEGEVGQWYKGRVMSNKDVKITHIWQTDVIFAVTAVESLTITKIVSRAMLAAEKNGFDCDRLSLEMDITAVHANGTPLKLQDLLDADDLDFAHDVWGIRSKIDRRTGQLTDHFLPRFAEWKP